MQTLIFGDVTKKKKKKRTDMKISANILNMLLVHMKSWRL